MGCSIVAESDIIHRSRRTLYNSTLSQTIDTGLPGLDIFCTSFFLYASPNPKERLPS